MQELAKGQKIKVDSFLELKFDNFYDVSCFCLNSQEKLIDDDHMVFYNQLTSPDNSVKLNKDGVQQSFSLNLANISPQITKLSFVITADDKELKDLNQKITCHSKDFSFEIQSKDLAKEKALMFCEVYIKDCQWRFNAYAQGFNAGLSAVVSHYGTEVASETKPTVVTSVEPTKKVSLTKISLTKDSQPAKISLKKDVDGNNMIEVSTIWFDNGDGNSGNDDLDLRVGLLLPDGRMTLIHSGELGSLDKKPYIAHGGDVQVVQGSQGIEKVKVNPNISKLYGGKVAIVFSVYSAVSNGVVSVASLRPKMEIKTQDHLISCEFNNSVDKNPSIYTYVIGAIVVDGDSLTVKQLGMTSKPGSEETPWMMWDNNELMPSITINGPHHFKGQRISTNSVNIPTSGVSSGMFGMKQKTKVECRYVEYNDI